VIFLRQFQVRLIDLWRLINFLISILHVFVQADTDARQNRGAERGWLFDFRCFDGLSNHVGLVLHPELILCGTADGHEFLRFDAERFLQPPDYLHELIIEPLNNRPEHIAFCHDIAQTHERPHRLMIHNRTVAAGEVRQEHHTVGAGR